MSIRDEQLRWYGELWKEHGVDPRSVGWSERETQNERFYRLSRLFDLEQGSYTVHEIGSGLGDFGLFLHDRRPGAEYSGSEILPEFVEAAGKRVPGAQFFLRDVSEALPAERYDFVTQSGIFNGRSVTPPGEWKSFVFRMLDAMYSMARNGIAANFLTTYCDRELMREELHYQDPAEVIEHVVEYYSRHWEIDAGGPLYEYTLRVYRPEYVKRRYDEPALARFFKKVD